MVSRPATSRCRSPSCSAGWRMPDRKDEIVTFSKQGVRFPLEDGTELSAWLFLPEDRAKPLPGITMAHGYAGTRYHGIEPIAEAFADAGFAVLVHDHRGFGESGGEPRQD